MMQPDDGFESFKLAMALSVCATVAGFFALICWG
jgi:hypothetical protein